MRGALLAAAHSTALKNGAGNLAAWIAKQQAAEAVMVAEAVAEHLRLSTMCSRTESGSCRYVEHRAVPLCLPCDICHSVHVWHLVSIPGGASSYQSSKGVLCSPHVPLLLRPVDLELKGGFLFFGSIFQKFTGRHMFIGKV